MVIGGDVNIPNIIVLLNRKDELFSRSIGLEHIYSALTSLWNMLMPIDFLPDPFLEALSNGILPRVNLNCVNQLSI